MTEYKLTNETKEHDGIILHRIELTEDCRWGNKGDKGGWIESRDNLGGDGWVGSEACVWGDARVSGNALVFGDARVYGNAYVSGNAIVYGEAWVYGDACVFGDAQVYGNAMVSGFARVSGNVKVSGNANVWGDAWLFGSAQVSGNVMVNANIIILDGEWDENIMYLQIREGISMNMSGPGILRIGNQHKPIGEWLEDKNFKYRRYVWIFVDEYGLGDVHNCDQEK